VGNNYTLALIQLISNFIMKKIGLVFGFLVFFVIISLMVIGTIVPETYVYLGRQVPKKYVNEIKTLGLLDDGEKIKYLYTDGFFDIKDGVYFVTDQKLVVYCKEWLEPETLIRFDEIIKLDIEYDNSFLEDSFIFLETTNGLEVEFPVSSEKNRDKAFYEYLLEKSGLE